MPEAAHSSHGRLLARRHNAVVRRAGVSPCNAPSRFVVGGGGEAAGHLTRQRANVKYVILNLRRDVATSRGGIGILQRADGCVEGGDLIGGGDGGSVQTQ